MRPSSWRARTPPFIGSAPDRSLQRRRVDSAYDLRLGPRRKLDLKRAAAGRPDWTKRRGHRRYEALNTGAPTSR
jgi:hypothetical protein